MEEEKKIMCPYGKARLEGMGIDDFNYRVPNTKCLKRRGNHQRSEGM
ncbi:hypothetical protein COLO4_26602 [Corchorus olitorius]|uniref:Uncharacterized protein n=1 Tax=Corchorus olitorius TaxID=93759 RepID=A0A1R3HVX6_9ROSI|nr:hypothetical protein COLO4_26602 [Corchorus olitorius]